MPCYMPHPCDEQAGSCTQEYEDNTAELKDMIDRRDAIICGISRTLIKLGIFDVVIDELDEEEIGIKKVAILTHIKNHFEEDFNSSKT